MTKEQKTQKRPGVGVAVIVIKNGQVLLGKRKGSHGPGTWNFPGGKLDFYETLEDCAQREAREEAGIEIKVKKFLTITNDMFKTEGKHYVTIFMISDYLSGDVKVMEPEKCTKWNWFNWDNLPHPLFLPIKNLLSQKSDLAAVKEFEK